jgi:stearoyl-CoA desaturase (Delta-9 desaturase)
VKVQNNEEKIIFQLVSVYAYLAVLGNAISAHRYYTHRSFKAKFPLQILLMICHTLILHRSLWTYVRDHKLHHKYSDTVGDPHNTQRGIFFCHVGWIFMPKSPEVLKAEKEVDMTELENDPIVMWQKKYYEIIVALMITIGLSIGFLWNESLLIQTGVAGLASAIASNIVWFV